MIRRVASALAACLLACAAAPPPVPELPVAVAGADAGAVAVADAVADAGAVAVAVADAGADAVADAGAVAVAPPWCDAQYENTPCAFRARGECYLRHKNCTNKPCTEAAWGITHCPSGAPPAFMLKPQVCGRRPGEPVEPRHTGWAAVPPSCDAALTAWANVPHADRSCKVDADCTVVTGSCFHGVIARRAASRYPPACSPPGAGMCSGGAAPARCEAGCCVLEGGGFGTVEPAQLPVLLP